MELLAANVDEDLPNHPDVQALETEKAPLVTALTTAEGALTATVRGQLDDWEAAVPDASWGNLLAFEAARRRLTVLAALDPADLETAVTEAEDDLVTALEADLKRQRTRDLLRSAASAHRRSNDVNLALRDRRRLGAVRGDQ
jgi:hypothetical protein